LFIVTRPKEKLTDDEERAKDIRIAGAA